LGGKTHASFELAGVFDVSDSIRELEVWIRQPESKMTMMFGLKHA